MKSFRTNILNIHGDCGQQWLVNINQLVLKAAAKYSLLDLKPITNLTYNYVLSGSQQDRPIILKFSLDADYLKHEAVALLAFEQFGAVKVIAEEAGMLLMERAVPGTSLMSYFPHRNTESIEIAAKLIIKLHQAPIPAGIKFPTLADWLKPLDEDWPIKAEHLIEARKLRAQLFKTTPRSVLLHGDLHHDNILQSGNSWTVIDPKGVIGDPDYEVAAFMRNPIPALLDHPEVKNILKHRIALFARLLKSSQERIYNWSFVQSVLSQIWAIENNNDTDYHRRFTEVFENLYV